MVIPSWSNQQLGVKTVDSSLGNKQLGVGAWGCGCPPISLSARLTRNSQVSFRVSLLRCTPFDLHRCCQWHPLACLHLVCLSFLWWCYITCICSCHGTTGAYLHLFMWLWCICIFLVMPFYFHFSDEVILPAWSVCMEMYSMALVGWILFFLLFFFFFSVFFFCPLYSCFGDLFGG